MNGGERALHRAIALTAPEPGTVVAELEDDFHHFRVSLHHDGERVTAILGEGLRHPWTTCPDAAGELAGLVGAPLADRSTAIGAHLVARRNCTHLYDLAGLALAHARRGRAERRYHAVVPDRDANGVSRPWLERDGERLLTWTIRDQLIEAPEPFAGQPLRGGFLAWADGALEPAVAEAAIVLRRAIYIAWGRQGDLDQFDVASQLHGVMTGTCYTFSDELMPVAFRVKGSTRDFSADPSRLLAGAD